MRTGAVVLAVGLLAGCGGGTVAVEASAPVVDDAPHAGITKFLRDWCCGTGSEWGPGPATVAEAVERSGLVVLASVGGVRPGYVVHSRCRPDKRKACDPFSGASVLVELTSVQVLRGNLPPGTDLLVGKAEAFSDKDPDGTKGLRARLPKGGQAVWFLSAPQPYSPPPPLVLGPNGECPMAPAGPAKPGAACVLERPVEVPDPERVEYQRTAYHVIDSRATFVQGRDGVLAPMAMEDGPEYLGEESVLGIAARYETLSELVQDVRDVAPAAES